MLLMMLEASIATATATASAIIVLHNIEKFTCALSFEWPAKLDVSCCVVLLSTLSPALSNRIESDRIFESNPIEPKQIGSDRIWASISSSFAELRSRPATWRARVAIGPIG